jgi:hypothetical protein
VGIHWWEFNRQRANIRSIIWFYSQNRSANNKLATTFVISITGNFTWSRLNRV